MPTAITDGTRVADPSPDMLPRRRKCQAQAPPAPDPNLLPSPGVLHAKSVGISNHHPGMYIARVISNSGSRHADILH